MNAKDAIKSAIKGNFDMLKMYLADLNDADLLVRPVPNANHIAWQLGHLIASEAMMVRDLPGARPADLPPDFATAHSKETAGNDGPNGFFKKDQYLELYEKVHAHTLASIDRLSDSDLDRETTGRTKDFAPTIGVLLLMFGTHIMMHVGQFTVVRRKLGKPILF